MKLEYGWGEPKNFSFGSISSMNFSFLESRFEDFWDYLILQILALNFWVYQSQDQEVCH